MADRFNKHQPVKNVVDSEKQRVYDLLMVQQNITLKFDEMDDKRHFDSFLIEDVSLTSGSVNLVEHLLGRNIVGYFLCNQNAEATIWEDEDEDVDASINLALQCSADVTIKLVVF